MVVGRAGDDGAVAVRQVECPLVGLAVPQLDAGDRTSAEVLEQLAAGKRPTHGQANRDGTRIDAGSAPPGPLAQIARGGGEHFANGVVELANAAESGGEGDVGHREIGRLDQDSSGLGTLRPGERERSGAELVGQQPVEVAAAVPEMLGQPRHALTVDEAVGDQAHRPSDEIAAQVPLGRAGRGVGATALAGPEAELLGSGGRAVELDVGALRGDRRAAGSAIDTGRSHGDVEPAVEPGVAALGRPVTPIRVEHEGG